MVRLDKIQVRNFKNIEFADLSLGDVNVIVGPNGAGKSNLLKVISLVNLIINGSKTEVELLMHRSYNATYGDIMPHNIRYGFKQGSSDDDIRISINFSDETSRTIYYYFISIGRDIETKLGRSSHIVEEGFSYKKKSNKGKPQLIFLRTQERVKYGEVFKKISFAEEISPDTSVIKFLNIFSKSFDESLSLAIENLNKVLQTETCYFSNHALKNREENVYKVIDNRTLEINLESTIIAISKTKDWELYKEALKDIVHVDDISIGKYKFGKEEREFVMFFQYLKMHGIEELSDGTVLLIALITKLFSKDSDILFIEEPENSIHPKALEDLIKFIYTLTDSKQFVISTHSNALLNMIKPEEVIVAKIGVNGMSNIAPVENLKDLKRKLSQSFISFGDLLYKSIDEDEYEDIP